MSDNLRIVKLLSIFTAAFMLIACAPEVGSAKWCNAIQQKPKGDLTLNEAKDYAKHCVFK